MLKGKVHLSTITLVTIGLFDLVSSMIWLHMGYAEGNPLFAWLGGHGALAFAVGKIVLLAGPVLILEFARKHHPRSAEQGTWIAAGAYAFLYIKHLIDLYR